jgi:hypothetical protein
MGPDRAPDRRVGEAREVGLSIASGVRSTRATNGCDLRANHSESGFTDRPVSMGLNRHQPPKASSSTEDSSPGDES